MGAVFTFATSTIGRWVIGAALLLAVYATGYTRATIKAEGACEAAALRSQLAVTKFDLQLARDIAAMDAAALAEAVKADAENKRVINEMRSQASGCRLSGNDARRLQRIR